jgi:hypothetical protein
MATQNKFYPGRLEDEVEKLEDGMIKFLDWKHDTETKKSV